MSDAFSPRSLAFRWRLPLALFVATVISVFVEGAIFAESYHARLPELGFFAARLHGLTHLAAGWSFAVPLLAILVTHELGHYFAAMIHRVPASLPFFIPLPLFSPFGTMGAVIDLPDRRIPSRNALVDIGAAGPIAGMVVAIPVIIIGLAQSEIQPVAGPAMLEGNCLLYLLLKHLVVGPIPPGHDVFLSPTAFAGWAGLLVTMLNLFPVAQLDGGHISYALFGEERQGVIDKVLVWALPLVFVYNLVRYESIAPGMVWLIWFGLLALIMRYGEKRELPPVAGDPLSPARRAVGLGCLILFALLFMPTPMRLG